MMERLLKHPTWLKIFSVALAILLWTMVMPKYTRDETALYEVPLHVKYHPDLQVDEGPRDNERFVTVRVTGKNLLVSRVRPDLILAEVDYTKVTEPGKQTELEVQVDYRENLKGLTFAATPRTLSVVLIKNQEATVPVDVVSPTPTVVMQDNREWSYSAKAEVDQVRISGRSDLLAAVKTARVTLDQADLTPGTTRVQKEPNLVDDKGKPVEQLTAPRVNVVITWRELPPGKPFKVNPITKGALGPGLYAVSAAAQPSSILVRAVSLGGKLPDQAMIDTEPIDLTGRTQTFTTPVRVVPPAGTTVSVEQVSVTVTVAELAQERLLKGLPLTIKGKATNADVTANVTDVQVHLKGLYSAVNAVEPGQLSVFVDVEGLATGKHVLPVKVLAPAGVTADPDPAAVEINIATP